VHVQLGALRETHRLRFRGECDGRSCESVWKQQGSNKSVKNKRSVYADMFGGPTTGDPGGCGSPTPPHHRGREVFYVYDGEEVKFGGSWQGDSATGMDNPFTTAGRGGYSSSPMSLSSTWGIVKAASLIKEGYISILAIGKAGQSGFPGPSSSLCS